MSDHDIDAEMNCTEEHENDHKSKEKNFFLYMLSQTLLHCGPVGIRCDNKEHRWGYVAGNYRLVR